VIPAPAFFVRGEDPNGYVHITRNVSAIGLLGWCDAYGLALPSYADVAFDEFPIGHDQCPVCDTLSLDLEAVIHRMRQGIAAAGAILDGVHRQLDRLTLVQLHAKPKGNQ